MNEVLVNDNNSMIIVNAINNYDLKYILAILNSRLISFWFLHTYGKFQRKVFPQFKINELREFPIKEIKPDEQQLLIDKVDAIMEAKKNNHDTSQLDAEIDALVYQLYRLTPDEINVIEKAN